MGAMDAVLVERNLRQYFATHRPEVIGAWLFGSVARGKARRDSDVDVAVLLASDPPRTLEGLAADLAAELGRVAGRTVDLVIVNRASSDLVHHVLRDGRLLADRDRAARILFEVRKRREFLDLKPILDRIRKRSRR